MGAGGRQAGLRMPAEWAPHERTLIAWPAREEAWRGATIEQARDVNAQVVAAVAAFEPVTLVVDPAHAADAPQPRHRRARRAVRRCRSTTRGCATPVR